MAKEKRKTTLSEVVSEKIYTAISENAKKIGYPDRFDPFDAADQIRRLMDLWNSITRSDGGKNYETLESIEIVD